MGYLMKKLIVLLIIVLFSSCGLTSRTRSDRYDDNSDDDKTNSLIGKILTGTSVPSGADYEVKEEAVVVFEQEPYKILIGTRYKNLKSRQDNSAFYVAILFDKHVPSSIKDAKIVIDGKVYKLNEVDVRSGSRDNDFLGQSAREILIGKLPLRATKALLSAKQVYLMRYHLFNKQGKMPISSTAQRHLRRFLAKQSPRLKKMIQKQNEMKPNGKILRMRRFKIGSTIYTIQELVLYTDSDFICTLQLTSPSIANKTKSYGLYLFIQSGIHRYTFSGKMLLLWAGMNRVGLYLKKHIGPQGQSGFQYAWFKVSIGQLKQFIKAGRMDANLTGHPSSGNIFLKVGGARIKILHKFIRKIVMSKLGKK